MFLLGCGGAAAAWQRDQLHRTVAGTDDSNELPPVNKPGANGAQGKTPRGLCRAPGIPPGMEDAAGSAPLPHTGLTPGLCPMRCPEAPFPALPRIAEPRAQGVGDTDPGSRSCCSRGLAAVPSAGSAGSRLALAQQTQPVNFHWGCSQLMSSERDPGWSRGIPQESRDGKGQGPCRRERPHPRTKPVLQ